MLSGAFPGIFHGMPDRPHRDEQEYFAREDVEKLRRLSRKQSEALAKLKREELRKTHYMKCPKCGFDLHTLKRGEVEIDTCFECKGVWLDEGELERVLQEPPAHRGTVIRAVLNLFKSGSTG